MAIDGVRTEKDNPKDNSQNLFSYNIDASVNPAELAPNIMQTMAAEAATDDAKLAVAMDGVCTEKDKPKDDSQNLFSDNIDASVTLAESAPNIMQTNAAEAATGDAKLAVEMDGVCIEKDNPMDDSQNSFSDNIDASVTLAESGPNIPQTNVAEAATGDAKLTVAMDGVCTEKEIPKDNSQNSFNDIIDALVTLAESAPNTLQTKAAEAATGDAKLAVVMDRVCTEKENPKDDSQNSFSDNIDASLDSAESGANILQTKAAEAATGDAKLAVAMDGVGTEKENPKDNSQKSLIYNIDVSVTPAE